MSHSCYPHRLPRARIAVLAGLTALSLLLAAAPAQAFDGATLRGSSFGVSFGPRELLPRIVCPGATTSTGRPGDFSFCRGTIAFYSGGTLIARGPFSVRTFDSHIERIPLTAAGRATLRGGRAGTFTYAIVSHDGQGVVKETRGSATFRR